MWEQLIIVVIGAFATGLITYLFFKLKKKREEELTLINELTELLSECYHPLKYLVNRGGDRLSEGTKGLLYKLPTIEKINDIKVKYEHELNEELIDHLNVITRGTSKGKSAIDGIEIFKIEREDLDDKYNIQTTREFKARILELIDKEINLLMTKRNKVKKKLSNEVI